MFTQERRALFVFGLILHACKCTGEIKVSLQGATLSTDGSVWDDWVLNRTIDGRTGNAEECKCCTAIKRPTWLQLNLPQTYFVKRVVLQGRTNVVNIGRLYQFRNITMFGGNADNHMVELWVTTSSDTIRTYEISPPHAMQAIRVVGQQGPDYMTICEIEVYRQEDCIIGTYGPNCEQRCHCMNGPCDTLTGTCGTGCQSGWRGAACNTTCDNGWYGRDCLSRCGICLNSTACNKTSGMCPDGCAAGYKGSFCKDGDIKVSLQGATLSTNGSIWDDWVLNRTIDGMTGRAEECKCCTAIKRPTWLQLNLPQTYFVKRVVLQGRTIVVDGANHQFTSITMFGGNADNHMVEQRVTSVTNTIRTYEISPPHAMQAIRVVGQQGPDYMTICEIEVYRQEDCIIGTYGPNCEQRCHCMSGPCDTLTGTCGTGCQSGWRGAVCNTTCDNGWYGRDCLLSCGICLNNTACNKTSGMCPDGCAAGYKGSLCEDAAEEKTTIELSHGELVGVVLSAIATGAVCSVVAVLCLRHRRRQTSTSNNMDRCQGTAVSAYDALSPTTKATSHYDTLTMTIPPTSSECEQIPTALKKVEENRRLQLNQKTVAATYENLSPNLTTGEEQYEKCENS
ncbi:hypothetical protein DPMN_086226 [Dreissena polymorpha]|uniref:EGF-like domain-containing protein n=1 Tax=Dreissena polymorpha TaxID=45954 RepID=A0A9D4BK29_DREPO|nr:hypothetical protein DPMN_086226 [Dreissena polymorpha]